MRLAGLRIVKNSELDALKSKKAKYDFLKQCFIDAGFKPDQALSIKSCKKFKEKREKEKEIAELDVKNIIETGPRRTRNTAMTSLQAAAKRPIVSPENAKKIPHVRLNRVVEFDNSDTSVAKDEAANGDDESEDEDEDEEEDKVAASMKRMKDLISSGDESTENDKKKKTSVSSKKIDSSDSDNE